MITFGVRLKFHFMKSNMTQETKLFVQTLKNFQYFMIIRHQVSLGYFDAEDNQMDDMVLEMLITVFSHYT